jgi:HD-like signal output (HDOD) protein
VAAHWGLPEEIVSVVHHHHDLAHAPEGARRDVALVELADAVAKEVAPAKIRTSEEPGELEGALTELGIEPWRVPEFAAGVAEKLKKVGESY